MPDHLARTPVHTFGDTFFAARKEAAPTQAPAPVHLRRAADFECCVSWPYCGCVRDCAAATGEQRSGLAFWVALALATIVPVVFAGLLVLMHFFPGSFR